MKFDDDFNRGQGEPFTPDLEGGSEGEIDLSSLEFDTPLEEDTSLLSFSDESSYRENEKSYVPKERAKNDKRERIPNNGKSKKPVIIAICSIVGVIIIALFVVLFLLPRLNSGNPSEPSESLTINENSELEVESLSLDGVPADFIIANGVTVNEKDIGGKTVAQA